MGLIYILLNYFLKLGINKYHNLKNSYINEEVI